MKTQKGRRGILLKILFLVLLLADISYTFLSNHKNMFLDGDMAGIVGPSWVFDKVMSDPFALDVLLHKERCNAPNRYFIHLFMQQYYMFTPGFLQHFVSPIESVFLAASLLNTLFHVSLVFLLAVFVSGSFSPWNLRFLTAAIIISPFLQVNGYVEHIGIYCNSVTYTIFYALPMILVLIYFLPFWLKWHRGIREVTDVC